MVAARANWLRRRAALNAPDRERRQHARLASDALRARQPVHEDMDTTLITLREERA